MGYLDGTQIGGALYDSPLDNQDDLLAGDAGSDRLGGMREVSPGVFSVAPSDWEEAQTPTPTAGTNTMRESEADKIAKDPRFNTQLDPTEEPKFQQWKAINAPKDSGYDYDLRGAYKAGLSRDEATNHMDDKFKKPNHPTFSTFSDYASLAPDKAGTWDGDTYVPAAELAKRTGVFNVAAIDGYNSRTDMAVSSPDQQSGSAVNLALTMARSAPDAMQMFGSLVEGFAPDGFLQDVGNQARQAGMSLDKYITSKMDPDWVQAQEKSFLDFSENGALRDPKAWIGGVMRQIPLIVATMGAGAGVEAGSLALGASEAAARKIGFMSAGAASSAGDAASSAAQAADEAGLSPEQRRHMENVAEVLGGGVGVITGPLLGKLFHGETGGIVKSGATAIAEQALEEGATQASSEYAKTTEGLPFDWRAVAEAAAQGVAVGGVVGGAVGARNRLVEGRNAKKEEAGKAKTNAELQAIKDEVDRINAEKIKQREDQEAQAGAYSPAYPAGVAPPVVDPATGTMVAGGDPSARKEADRDALKLSVLRAGSDVVKTQQAVDAATSPTDRAKLVGEWRKQKERLTSLQATLSNLPEDLEPAALGQPQGPAQTVPAEPPSLPAMHVAAMEPRLAQTVGQATEALALLHQEITKTSDPSARAELVQQWRGFHSKLQDLESGSTNLPAVSRPVQPIEQAGGPQAETLAGVGFKYGGKLYSGQDHEDAMLAALKDGVPEAAIDKIFHEDPSAVESLVTSKGRVVSFEEAKRIAEKAGETFSGSRQADYEKLRALTASGGPVAAPAQRAPIDVPSLMLQAPGPRMLAAPTPSEAAPAGTVDAGRPVPERPRMDLTAQERADILFEPHRITSNIEETNRELESLRAKIEDQRHGPTRAKQVGQFRALTKKLAGLNQQLDAAVKRYHRVNMTNPQQMALPGFEEPNYQQVAQELDRHLPDPYATSSLAGPQPEPYNPDSEPPLIRKIRYSAQAEKGVATKARKKSAAERAIKRSQAAKVGAATRAENRAKTRAAQEASSEPVPPETQASGAASPATDAAVSSSSSPPTVTGAAPDQPVAAPTPQPASQPASLPASTTPRASMGGEVAALREAFPARPAASDTPVPKAPPPQALGSPLGTAQGSSGGVAPPADTPSLRAPAGQQSVGISPEDSLPKVEQVQRAEEMPREEFIATTGDLNNTKSQVEQASGLQPSPEEHLPDPTAEVWAGPEDPDAPPLGVIDAGLQMAQPVKPGTMSSPRNVLARVLAQGPVGIDEMLTHLQTQLDLKDNKNLNRLLERLRRAFPASTTRPSPVKVENFKLGLGFQGLYDPQTDTVYVDLQNAEDPLQAVLHEMVHAAIITRSRLPGSPFKKQMIAMATQAKEYWDKNGFLPPSSELGGFRNHEEFITEALTNTAFNDKLAHLFSPLAADDGKMSVWGRLKNRVGAMLGLDKGTGERALYDQLLEFIPDGSYLEEAPNRAAVLAELDRLGLAQANAMFSTLRSMLRTVSPPVISGLAAPNGRVMTSTIAVYSRDMIVSSYAKYGKAFLNNVTGVVEKLNDAITSYARLEERKAGYAAEQQAKASRIVEQFKKAISSNPNSEIGALMVDARIGGLDPSKPSSDPINTAGMALPGSVATYADLASRWGAMNQDEHDAFELVRDHGIQIRTDEINQVMTARIRGMLGNAAADQLTLAINNQLTVPSVVGAGFNVELGYKPVLGAKAIDSLLQGLLPTDPAKAKKVGDALKEVHKLVGQAVGPWFPLRRYGQYLVIMKSDPKQAVMSKAQLDKMVADDRYGPNGIGTLLVSRAQPVATTGLYDVEYHHEQVEAHDSERAAEIAHDAMKADWTRAAQHDGRVVQQNNSNISLKRENAYAAMGLNQPAIDALRQEMEKVLGPGSGGVASEAIMRWYLEKLPETSVKKSRMRARGVAGASEDMLRAYAEYAQGTSYQQAQMRFGHQILDTLGRQIDEDVKKMQAGGNSRQGIDLRHVANELTRRNRVFMETAGLDRSAQGWSKMWRKAPNLAAAWVLTGPASIITNSLQPLQFTLPYLAARHGLTASAGAMRKAYGDVFKETVVEAWGEYGRAFQNLPAAARAVLARQQRATPSIKDPRKSFVEKITDKLTDPREKELMHALASRRVLDFGLVADLQSMTSEDGRFWSAVTYLSDAGFVGTQAAETLNRTVTSLTSYRLNLKKLMADPARAPGPLSDDEFNHLADVAADDTRTTQFNYSRDNKAPFMQKESMRAALVFKTYAANTWYLITHNLMQSLQAETKEQRAEAVKFLAGWTSITMATTGVGGVLLFEPIYALAIMMTALFGPDDEKDPEALLKRAMGDAPVWLADTVRKGAPYAMGVDMSRLGMGQMFPAKEAWTMATDPKSGKSDVYALIGQAMLGAPASIVDDMVGGGANFAQGNFLAGMQAMMPKALGINDIVRMVNYATHGIEDKNQNVSMTPDQIGWARDVVRGLGFTPSAITDKRAETSAWYTSGKLIAAKRDHLMDQFGKVVLSKGSTVGVIAQVRAFNQQHPEAAITKDSLMSSVKAKAKDRQSILQRGVPLRTKADQVRYLQTHPPTAQLTTPSVGATHPIVQQLSQMLGPN